MTRICSLHCVICFRCILFIGPGCLQARGGTPSKDYTNGDHTRRGLRLRLTLCLQLLGAEESCQCQR